MGGIEIPFPVNKVFFFQQLQHPVIEPIGAVVVEAVRNNSKNREAFWWVVKFPVASSVLFTNRIECVFRSRFIKLVDDDAVSKINHVDLLELSRGTILRGHDIDTEISKIGDFGVALSNPCCFNKDQVKG